MSLTCEEYESLLRFSSIINSDYGVFIKNVGDAMENLFQFPLTVYTIFNEDQDRELYVERIQGHTIYPDGLRRYQNGVWKSDLFIQRIHHSRQGKMQRHAIGIPDIASYAEFYATDYGKYLQNINTPYQVILRSIKNHSNPLHVLCVFKTAEQGEFTEHEIELLSRIGEIFSESVGRYKRYIEERFFEDFLIDEAAAANHNLAIINEHGQLVFYNQTFISLTAERFNIRGEEGCVETIRRLLRDTLQVDLFGITDPVVLRQQNCELSVSKRCYTWDGHFRQFYFILIHRDSNFGGATHTEEEKQSERLQDLISEYNFTTREAEITQLLITGMSNQQIADDLCVSLPTVKFHIQNIFQKLNVSNRSSAITKLLNNG